MDFRKFIGVCLVAAASLTASARIELPVTQVNGQACYCYTVEKKQTLYSVADKLGLTRDQIVKYNPAAADGVKNGQVLYFPVDEFPDLGDSDKTVALQTGTYTVKKGDSFYGICYKLGVTSDALLAANPSIAAGVKVGQVLKVPAQAIQQQTDDQTDNQAGQEADNDPGERLVSLTPVIPVVETIAPGDSVTIEKTANIVVMLPFMLNRPEPDKHALNATDFYKGMLMAADSLSSRPGRVNIYTFDTEGSTERVRQFCQTDTFRNAAVVIAPDDLTQLNIIGSHAVSDDLYVYNAFVVRDSSYLYNPRMLQSYIPSDKMLAKAANAVRDLFPGATPVVLHRQGSRTDKADFITRLTALYADTDTPVTTIEFTEALTAADLSRLPSGGNYVLIPASGSLAEFNKLSGGVLEAQEDALGGSTFALFGYPDWTSFRGPNRDMLHRLGATIYTRFYHDPFSPEVKQLEARYNSDFGGAMVDAVPSPALLGFDTAWFLINDLRRGGSEYVPENTAWYGAQSSFHFVKADPTDPQSGYYNDELYIIRFSIDGIHTDRLQ